MSDPLVPIGDGHTPLDDDDQQGLLLTYVTTRGELNDAEQRNITSAVTRRRQPTPTQLLDDRYLRNLHKAMFGEVWSWAGTYRQRETTIGVDPQMISMRVRDLTKDVLAWIEHETYPPDEIAVRFHDQLVFIHPFPNGNGRHTRLAADYLIQALGGARFTWGAHLGVTTEELRAAYLSALNAADRGSFRQLLAFSRS